MSNLCVMQSCFNVLLQIYSSQLLIIRGSIFQLEVCWWVLKMLNCGVNNWQELWTQISKFQYHNWKEFVLFGKKTWYCETPIGVEIYHVLTDWKKSEHSLYSQIWKVRRYILSKQQLDVTNGVELWYGSLMKRAINWSVIWCISIEYNKCEKYCIRSGYKISQRNCKRWIKKSTNKNSTNYFAWFIEWYLYSWRTIGWWILEKVWYICLIFICFICDQYLIIKLYCVVWWSVDMKLYMWFPALYVVEILIVNCYVCLIGSCFNDVIIVDLPSVPLENESGKKRNRWDMDGLPLFDTGCEKRMQ